MQLPCAVIRCLSLILCSITVSHALSPLEVWRGRNPLPTGEILRRAASADGLTLLAGGSGTNMLLVSTNGANWAIGATTGTRAINELIHANGLWMVAAGNNFPNGGGAIATSADATNWVVRLNSPARNYLGVAQGNGRFVAVSTSGIAISTDGLDWSEPFAGNTSGNAITFAFGKFFVGNNFDILVSSDGSSWSQATNTFASDIRAFAFGNGRLIGLGSSSSAWWTTDGSTWGRSMFLASGTWRSATYGNGLFVGVTDSSLIWTSGNGSNWFDHAVGNLSHDGVSFVNGQFVLAGGAGQIFTSPDGTNWTARHSNEGISAVKRIEYLNGGYVAVGDQALVMTSPDGVTWKRRSVFSSVGLRSVAHGNDIYLAGGGGNFVASTNGTNWAEIANGGNIIAVAFGRGVFVALNDFSGGSPPNISATTNGANWFARTNLNSGPLSDVTFANGLFVAVGSGPRIFTSTNGIQWTRQPVGFTEGLKAVTCGNGRFYAVATLDRLAYSDDGTNWSSVPLPPGLFPQAIAAGEGYVLLLHSTSPRVWFSPDLCSWSNVQLHSSYFHYAAAHGPGKFLIGGAGGQLWESAPVVHLTAGPPGTVIVSGPPNLRCEIQRNTDLNTTNWIPLGSFTLSNAPAPWFDPQLNPPPRAFYRGVAPSE